MKRKSNINNNLSELETDIKSYDRLIKRHPNNDDAYYSKAGALVKLAKITHEESYHEQALECYNRALAIYPNNALYLTDRSKLYIIMGRADLAAQDLLEVQKSPDMGNKVLNMYTTNTVQDILKLDDVQTEVKKLITDNKLPAELEGIFSNMITVISGISSRVSQQDDRLDSQAAELKSMKEDLAKYQEKYPALLNIIESMSSQITILQTQVTEHDQSIQAMAEQMARVCTKEEFAGLAERFDEVEVKQELFNGKITVMQGTFDSHETAIMTMDKSLEQSNCYNKQNIREGFEELKAAAPNQVLYDYANNFYWCLSNYLLAYRSISTGAVQGIRDKNQLEKIWDKVGSVVVNVTNTIPIAGGTLSLIEGGISYINNAYKELKFDRKVEKINELITNYMLEEDLNLAIASASIKVARIKSDEILSNYQEGNQSEQSTAQKLKSSIDKKVAKFEEKIDKLLTKVTKISSSQETPAGKMAIKDVVLFINYLATHEIALITEDNANSLDEVIAEAFNNNISNTKQAISNAIASNNNNNNKDKCIIAMGDKIVYDNPLLNHIELLQDANQHFGMSKALDLSEALSPELVSEAIATHDQTLILAGMMSLCLGSSEY